MGSALSTKKKSLAKRRASRASNIRFHISTVESQSSRTSRRAQGAVSNGSTPSVDLLSTSSKRKGIFHRKKAPSQSKSSSIQDNESLPSSYENDFGFSDGSSAMAAAFHAAASATGFTTTYDDLPDITESPSLPTVSLRVPNEISNDDSSSASNEGDTASPRLRPALSKLPSGLSRMEFCMPPDHSVEKRKESDRQQRQHYMMKYAWGANHMVSLTSPELIIDWCCGIGIWDIELAQEFPQAKVVGIDYEKSTFASHACTLSNVSFKTAAIYQGQSGLEEFEDNVADFVMIRDVWFVNSDSKKWLSALQEVYRVLKPGSWVEIYEQDQRFESPGPHFLKLSEWENKLNAELGIERDIIRKLDENLQTTGFINIDERCIELPLGEWASTPALKEMGYLIKDLSERHYRVQSRWICELNSVKQADFEETLKSAMRECEVHKSRKIWRYFAGQKPVT